MHGYSGRPLAKKLGIKPDFRIIADNAPEHYRDLLAPLPAGVEFATKLTSKIDLLHLFTEEAKELTSRLKKYLTKIKDDAVIWVSWPKKAAKIATDISEDVIRAVA